MNSKNVIKKGLLLRKIQEYFVKNPNKTSAIFKASSDGNTYWKVSKGKRGFNVMEVNTSKASFVLGEAAPLPNPDDKLKPEPMGSDKTSVDKTASGFGQMGGPPPSSMGAVKTNIEPGNPKGAKPTPQRMGPPNTQSASTKPMGTAGRPPEPMDDAPPPSTPMSKGTKKKVDAHMAKTQSMLKWTPGGSPNGQPNEFMKSLMKTKDIGATLKKMPSNEFTHAFNWTGAKNAAELAASPEKMKKVTDFLHQSNPYIAQMLGGNKAVNSGVKREGVLRESPSDAFAKISSAYMKFQANPKDHKASSEFIQTLTAEKSKVMDPIEKQVLAAIEKENMGLATKNADASTRQTAFGSGAVAAPAKGLVSAGRTLLGRIMREEDEKEKDDKPKKKDKEEPEEKDLGSGSSIKDTPTEDDVEAGQVTPGPDAAGGLDGGEESPEAPEAPTEEPEKKGEEAVVSDRLAGQTIKNASVELQPHGGSITLELVGTKIPASLSWDTSGKVVFTFKNRPYILRRA